jgi:hypothetical protein
MMLRPVIVDTEFAPRGGHYEVRCVSWHDSFSVLKSQVKCKNHNSACD